MVVLYIDDDVDDLELFGEAIREVDPEITCVTAGSGEEALNLLSGKVRPDCVFLDINMPIMDGIECLNRIRAIPALENLPVTMLSTSNSEKDRNESRSLQAGFINKPNSFDKLVAALTSKLKER